MRMMTEEEADRVFKETLRAGEDLVHLPFARLGKATKHKLKLEWPS